MIRSPPSGAPGARKREEQDDDRGDHEQHGRRKPARSEHGVAQDLSDRRPGPVCEHRDREDPDPPADDDARERGRARLRPGKHAELIPARAEPRQPLPGALDVAAHPGRGQDREREQERRGLAADEQQPPPRDLARLPRCGELVDRRGQVEEERFRAQRRAGPRRGGRELVDLPGMHAVGGERRRPGVGAVEALEARERREPVEALGDEERRLAGKSERLADARRVRAGEPAERKRRDERSLAHLDEAQALDARHAAGAAQLDDLAAFRGAGFRQPPRREPDEAPEVVGCGKVRELAADAQELQLHGAHRSARGEAGERAVDERLDVLARDAVSRDAEIGVDDRDRALVRRHALERAGERLVLRHEASPDHRGEGGGGRGDPQREQPRAAGPVDEPVPRQPQGVADPSRRVHEYTLTEAEEHDH